MKLCINVFCPLNLENGSKIGQNYVVVFLIYGEKKLIYYANS